MPGKHREDTRSKGSKEKLHLPEIKRRTGMGHAGSPPPEIRSRHGSLGNSRSDQHLGRNLTTENFSKKKAKASLSRSNEASESNLKV